MVIKQPGPPMRVVTKGWWVMREELVSVEELEKVNKSDERIAKLETQITQLKEHLAAEKKKGGVGLAFLAGKRRIVPF